MNLNAFHMNGRVFGADVSGTPHGAMIFAGTATDA